MKAELHGGPCDGRVDHHLRAPAPDVYPCGPDATPSDRDDEAKPHRYRLVRVERNVAHYEFGPDP